MHFTLEQLAGNRNLLRFLEYIEIDAAGCWLWRTAGSAHGYGQFRRADEIVPVLAHRHAYELFKGPIPHGYQVDHLCRVRRCVNPEHLEAVTGAVNTQRAAQAKTHCIHGHLYVGENIGVTSTGGGRIARYCRVCKRDRSKKRQAA